MNQEPETKVNEEEKKNLPLGAKAKLLSFFKLSKQKNDKTMFEPVKRIEALPEEGLSEAQVEKRKAQGLVNKTGKTYSKSYRSIFVGNLCTFFNLLCLLAAVALLLARAPISQFMFVLIFLCNICEFSSRHILYSFLFVRFYII